MEENAKIAERISDLLYRDILGLANGDEQEELSSLMVKYHLKDPKREEVIEHLERKDFINKAEINSQLRKFRYVTGIQRQRFIRWTSIAATIVIFITAGWWLGWKVITEKRENSIVYYGILPGQSNATITLVNGQRIELKKSMQQITEYDGTILKTENGKLVYHSQHNGSEAENKYNILSIPRGGEYQLELSDGTKVWLNAETELKYPLKFKDSVREVYLKGEAYFEVIKKENCKFRVYSSNGSIEVLGTAFNVRDYAEEQSVVTTLVSGKVSYTSDSSQEKIMLRPGYQVTDPKHGRAEMKKVALIQYTGWKDGQYVFENATLENIMKTLERWYDINVVWLSPNIKELHFTGDLKRYDSINIFLKFIETGGDVKFRTKGKTIFVDKK